MNEVIRKWNFLRGSGDPKYNALIAYATSQGYSLPSASVKTALNTLCSRFTANNLWGQIEYFFTTDGDRNFAKINVANPGTNNATETNTPTFTSLYGFKSNGTTSYLKTGLLLQSGAVLYSQDNISTRIYLNDSVNANIIPYGCETAGHSYYHNLAKVANLEIVRSNQASSGASATLGDLKGFWEMARTGSTTGISYFNGLQSVSSGVASVTMPDKELYVLASNDASAVEGYCTSNMGYFGLGPATLGKELLRAAIWAEYFSTVSPG